MALCGIIKHHDKNEKPCVLGFWHFLTSESIAGLSASCTTCVSSGMISVRRSMMSAHKPRSTGESVRTIQRRNMHTRLHADCVLRGTTVLALCSAK